MYSRILGNQEHDLFTNSALLPYKNEENFTYFKSEPQGESVQCGQLFSSW